MKGNVNIQIYQKPRRQQDRKARQPYPEFALFPHDKGRWAKKIRGKLVYFGKWIGQENDGWETAVDGI